MKSAGRMERRHSDNRGGDDGRHGDTDQGLAEEGADVGDFVQGACPLTGEPPLDMVVPGVDDGG